MPSNIRHSRIFSAARAAFVFASVMTLVATGWAQINLTDTNATQNFDSMGTSTNASLPAGWRYSAAGQGLTTVYWTNTGNLTTNTQGASSGSPTSGGRYNWGWSNNSASNRAAGFLTSGSYARPNSIMVAYSNNTGLTVTNLSVSYNIYRFRTANTATTNLFYFSTNPASWGTARVTNSWAAVASTNYFFGTNVAASNTATVSQHSIPVTISNGAVFYMSWIFTAAADGNGQGLGLDNFSLTAQTQAAVAIPTITGAATASAFATTYGTASAAQTFGVSGSNLTADLVATAPPGFEVSSDGTTYGGTATFTQTSGSASGTLRVRLAATAAVSGAYNSQNIVLSSTGATSVNITTASSGNSVTAKGLTITGLSAANKNWDGTTTASVTGAPAYSGLANSESFSVTGSVTWAFPDANVGSNRTLTRTGNYDAPSANYTVTQPTLTASINAVAPSAPSITGVTEGDAQLSVAFTAPSSNGGATITNYEYSTNGGTTWTTPSPAITSSPLAITGLVNGTTYDVQLRAVNSAGSGTATATTQATPVAPASPTITALPAVLGSALSTTYGTPSATQSFTVLGATLSGNLTVTAPAGLQVSTNSSTGFASSLELVATSGSVSSTTIYARLAAAASAGSYNGQNISVSGGGATTQNVATAASGNTVAQAPLTITGISISNKVYDGNTTATIAGTAAYSGLVNGETFSITGTPAANFANKTVADGKSVTVSGYEAPSANYSITQPAGLTANITPKALTVSDAVAVNKVFDGTTSATITGNLSGVVSGDVVTFSGTGTFASADVGTGIVVTSTSTLGGVDAGNYSLTQPTGLTANITQATQTITFNLATNTVTAGTTNALTAAASSGLAVSYNSANTNVARIANLTNVVAVAPGVTTITASQAGNSNVAAAEPVSRTLNVAGSGVSTNLFSENMGTPSGTTTIATNTFQNSATLTYSNGGQTNSADVRATSTSSGYSGASGGGNVFFTSTSGAYGFSIENINASGFGSLQLSYAYRKESGSAHAAFSVDYWNGTAWVTVANTAADLFSEAANASTAWYAARTLSLPSAAQINGLRIRFVKTGSAAIRIDDVRLAGTPNASAITPSGSFLALSTTYGTASAASASTAIVTGGSLTSNITATPPAGFEVSTNGSTWSSNAVFTNDGGFANGVLYLRLAANALAGTYSNQVVALTAGSASNSIAISNSTVNRYPITVGAVATNKVYGAPDPALTYTNASLLFSDTFSGSIARAAGDNAGTYTITQGTLTNANYDITFLTNTFTIDPKALTITADNVSKAFGVVLTTPQTGSTAFTSSGLVSGDSISSVTIAYTDGASSDAAAGLYTGVVVPSAPVGINTNNYSITFNAGDLTVDAAPSITVGTSSLSAFTTTYGTDSSTQNFTVTGGNLTGDVTVTAPGGFQVSTNASSGFGSSVLLAAAASTVPSTTIYVRIPGTANAATNYSGNISVTSDGATTRNISIATSTVSPKALTIDGLSATNRVYDATTNGTVSGAPVYAGLANDQSFEVTNNVVWSFANKNIGTNKALAASTEFTAPSANYTIASQPTFSANITTATLTLSGASATSRAYAAGNTNVTITGTLSGVFPGDVVGFNGTNAGTIASANAGTNIAVTANVSLSGADAGNYTLTQPTGLTVDITKATNTITFGALSNVTVGTTNALTATASSGLAVTYTSSNTNVATISGTNVVAVAAGVTTITASQAGDDNVEAATPVSRSLNVSAGGGTTTLLSENFNGISTNTTLPAGFRIQASTTNVAWGSASNTVTQVGTSNNISAGGTYNFGPNTNERSVGAMTSSGFGSPNSLMAVVTNSSGSTVSSFSVSYLAERFRVNTAAASVQLFASTNGSNWTAVTNGDVPATNFPTGTSSYTWNNPTTVSRSNVVVTNFSVANNGLLYLRWNIDTTGANSQAIGIDDVQVTASGGAGVPAITPSGSFLAVSTTYGTASAASVSTVAVSGGSLTSNITATPPAGFEVSTNGSIWSSSATFTQSGGFASGDLYLRLAATANAGAYSNQVVSLVAGSASNSIAIATSTVSRKALTVTAPTVTAKTYDGTTAATITGSLSGVVGDDAVSLNGTGTFDSANAGTGISVTSTSTLGGSLAGNYTLTQPVGLAGDITVKSLTGFFGAADKTYDGNAAATVTSRGVTGVVGSDDVNLVGGSATFADANVGASKVVTLTGATLSGTASGNYTLGSVSTTTANITAASLASNQITLTPVGDGSYTASGPAGSTFDLAYSGRTANGITTTYSSATAPTAAGYYTATATATGNYTGSNSSNFFVTGPIAANDEVSKIAAETAIVIEGSSLLTNDRRIDASGNVQTGGLSITGVTAGVGNAVQLDEVDVLFEVLTGVSPWTFTYTLTDTVANKTAAATVTVSDGATEQPFSLQIVRIGTATFNGTNTSVTHDFVGVPNQIYLIEYSTDLSTWTSAGNQSTGTSGSFSVTIARAGNVASAWNSAMFFRARLVTP